jgi:hypothetical protein
MPRRPRRQIAVFGAFETMASLIASASSPPMFCCVMNDAVGSLSG